MFYEWKLIATRFPSWCYVIDDNMVVSDEKLIHDNVVVSDEKLPYEK